MKNEKRASESGDGKEESVSDDGSRVQAIEDENVPKARLNKENLYWLIIPIVVLAVVFASIVYKKKQKKKVDS